VTVQNALKTYANFISQRYGITRAGDRVKLDCGGARCGYSDDSSDCSSEDEYVYEEKTTRRQGVVIRT
jgi:hypothetical protein